MVWPFCMRVVPVRKKLQNETLRVDTGCLVAFTQGVEFDIEMVSGLKSMFFGGEGLVTIHAAWIRLCGYKSYCSHV